MNDPKVPTMTSSAPGLSASLSLRSGNRDWGSEKRMALLAAIASEGSITAAARKIGMSYKAAWDAIDTMNNLADERLVERKTGGRRGGGAALTPRAVELLAFYQAARKHHDDFMSRLAGLDAAGADNLALMQHLMMRTSARNEFAGRVREIVAGAVNDEVHLELGDRTLVASISRESVQALGLRPGTRALAFINAASVMIATSGTGLRLSARNQLAGRIARVVQGAVNTDVCIEWEDGHVIAAMVSNQGFETLELQEGDAALAVFKASSVMLGVLD